MPRIDTYTAKGREGVLRLPGVSADSFGRQAFQGLGELGQTLQEVGNKIQQNEDDLNIVKMTSEYDIQLDQAKAEVLKHPAIHQHADMLAVKSQDIHDAIASSHDFASPSVLRTFQKHVASRQAPATIEVLHAGQVIRTQRVLAYFADTQDRLTQQAAMDPTKTQENFLLLNDIRSRLVDSGALSEVQAQKEHEASQHRYWSIFAQTRPQDLIDRINIEELSGTVPAGMDAQHRSTYINLAINALHTKQTEADHEQERLDAALKAAQEANAAKLKADILDGKPVQHQLAPLLRSRELDHDKVSGIMELQSKMVQVPDMARYQRGLATQIEAQLSASKYDNRPFDPSIHDKLNEDFVGGRLLKEEFTHLSGIARDVQAHKEDASQTPKNQTVSRAASNLEQVMESANKLTGFSAVGNQATASAKEYFYRRVEQEPNANPWDIMHDAEKRFKPIVEKQQGISKVDQMLLDDANVEARVQLGTLSKAAAKAYREKTQDERGRKAVNDALKALPPPPEPGILERLLKKFAPPGKRQERKEPGVMGQ